MWPCAMSCNVINMLQIQCKYFADWKQITGNNTMCISTYTNIPLIGWKQISVVNFQVWGWGALHRVTLYKGENNWQGHGKEDEEKWECAKIMGMEHVSVSSAGTQHCSGCSTTWPSLNLDSCTILILFRLLYTAIFFCHLWFANTPDFAFGFRIWHFMKLGSSWPSACISGLWL